MTKFSKTFGADTAYEIQGTGPALVLIHGAEGSRRSFDKITPTLSQKFTVISYDQRDCGATENYNDPVSLEILASDLKELLGDLGYATAHIYGTSFGGRVAQAFALLHPGMVDRLILASTWPLPLTLKDVNPETALIVFELRQTLPESAELLAEYFFPPDFLTKNPQYKAHFRAAKPRSDKSARRANTISGFLPIDLGNIGAKTLLMAGQLDRIVPPGQTIGMSRQIRDSECVLMQDVGHLSYIQTPDQVIQHIDRFFS